MSSSLAHLECGLALGFPRPPRTEFLTISLGPGSCPRAGPLSQGQVPSQRSPVTPVASCPCRAPGFQPLHLILQESKATPQPSSPVLPVALPGLPSASPLYRDLRWDALVCTETLVLCKQVQKDYWYFNPISSEPTNICHTR